MALHWCWLSPAMLFPFGRYWRLPAVNIFLIIRSKISGRWLYRKASIFLWVTT